MLATCFCKVCKVPKKRFQVQLLITGVQRENRVKWGSSRAKELHSDSSAFHNIDHCCKSRHKTRRQCPHLTSEAMKCRPRVFVSIVVQQCACSV